MRVRLLTVTSMPEWLNARKPSAWTVTVYIPGGMVANR